jgi:hypothetical protein
MFNSRFGLAFGRYWLQVVVGSSGPAEKSRKDLKRKDGSGMIREIIVKNAGFAGIMAS